ncbi:MAG: ABC transporter ATP-binding protein [Candidatus Dojkabacteria bacterium]|nr:MAG: ABC transporter ATP-binding protein [Candidatus Dojkabacteria bacterium]
MTNKAIIVKNLVKRYKKATENAVDDISFTVKEGEFFAFLGPNGAGKTTAISILTTTLSKTSGEVTVAGFDIEKQNNEVRKNIGIIFQNPSLDLNLTAEENIRFHAILYNLYPFFPSFALMPQSYKDKVMELAEIIGIKDDLNKPVKSFSGGMKRKLEIVRSLIHNPKVLFLDEPTTGLDPASRKNLWQYLKQVRKDLGTTVFLTTHYLDEAEGADKVVIINKGKIVAEGTPKQIKEDLVEKYLRVESKDMSSLEKELQQQKLEFTKDGDGFRVHITHGSEEIHQILKKITAELSDIDIHLPTLEEAYLEIIQGKPENV